MKNNYHQKKCNAYFKSVLFFLTLTSAFVFQNAKAQLSYKIENNSQVKVAIDSIKNNFTALANSSDLNAEANFTIRNGSLEEVNAFRMELPLSKNQFSLDSTLNNEKIGFKLTHVMVLPMMRLVHIVGMLNVGGVSNRAELDFSFLVNEDESITFFGAKSIKLSDYSQEPKFKTETLKGSNEVKLNMNFVFKNNQQNLLASTAK